MAEKMEFKWAFELSDLLDEKHNNEIEVDGFVNDLFAESNGNHRELKVPKTETIWSEIKKIVDYFIERYAFDGRIVFSFWKIKKHIETIVFIVHRLKAIYQLVKKS